MHEVCPKPSMPLSLVASLDASPCPAKLPPPPAGARGWAAGRQQPTLDLWLGWAPKCTKLCAASAASLDDLPGLALYLHCVLYLCSKPNQHTAHSAFFGFRLSD